MSDMRPEAIQALRPSAEWSLFGDTLDWQDKTQSEPSEKEITDKMAELVAAHPMTALREERNFRLSLCDWTQTTDNKLSDSKKAEWTTYRQALRDLTSTADPKVTESGNLYNVTFPTEPS